MIFSKNPEVKLDPSQKKKLTDYAMPLGFFAVGFLLIFLVGIPKLNSFSELSKSKKDSEEALRLISIKVNTLKTTLKPYEAAINQNYGKISHALPTEVDVPGLMTEVENIASSSGLAIESLQFTSAVKKPVAPPVAAADGTVADTTAVAPTARRSTLEEVSIQAAFSGTFDNIQLFLKKLENASRIVLADSLKYSPDRDTEGATEDRLLCNIGLISFYLPENNVLDPSEPLNFSLTSPDVEAILDQINKLDVYVVSATESAIGKGNPFE
jgi:Tfp pilus assembly protein PilO